MQPEESPEFVEEVRKKLFNVGEKEPVPGLDKALLITKHVAWQLRHLGYGLVKAKPGSENNHEGYTTDVVAKSDGFHVDILIDSGNTNGATWQPNYNPEHGAAIRPRYVEPINVGDIFSGSTGPTNPIPQSQISLETRIAKLEKLLAGGKIALKTSEGLYVCVDRSQGNHLIGDRAGLGEWEQLRIIFID